MESKHLAERTPNIMKTVTASKYRVVVNFGCGDAADAFAKIESELALERPLVVMKKTKSATKETDIRPMIHSIEFTDKGNGTGELLIITAAGNLTNLRPELAINSLCDVCGITCKIESIHRLELI